MKSNFFDVKDKYACEFYEIPPAEELIKLTDAVNYCKAFRTVSTGNLLGFFISKDTILKIINQNDDTDIDGIRIYLGTKEEGVEPVRTACITATVKGASNGTHDDYHLPEPGYQLPTTNVPLIGEARPCPEHCGKKSVLNS